MAKECPLGEHAWYRNRLQSDGLDVTMCRICGLDANELILGLRVKEIVGTAGG